jgi:hypothetical protein
MLLAAVVLIWLRQRNQETLVIPDELPVGSLLSATITSDSQLMNAIFGSSLEGDDHVQPSPIALVFLDQHCFHCSRVIDFIVDASQQVGRLNNVKLLKSTDSDLESDLRLLQAAEVVSHGQTPRIFQEVGCLGYPCALMIARGDDRESAVVASRRAVGAEYVTDLLSALVVGRRSTWEPAQFVTDGSAETHVIPLARQSAQQATLVKKGNSR